VRPEGLTARELFEMESGRCQQRRVDIVAQAALVWTLADATPESLMEFVRCGQLPSSKSKRPRLDPQLRAAVDRKIDEIVAHGGRLIVTPE